MDGKRGKYGEFVIDTEIGQRPPGLIKEEAYI